MSSLLNDSDKDNIYNFPDIFRSNDYYYWFKFLIMLWSKEKIPLVKYREKKWKRLKN